MTYVVLCKFVSCNVCVALQTFSKLLAQPCRVRMPALNFVLRAHCSWARRAVSRVLAVMLEACQCYGASMWCC